MGNCHPNSKRPKSQVNSSKADPMHIHGCSSTVHSSPTPRGRAEKANQKYHIAARGNHRSFPTCDASSFPAARLATLYNEYGVKVLASIPLRTRKPGMSHQALVTRSPSSSSSSSGQMRVPAERSECDKYALLMRWCDAAAEQCPEYIPDVVCGDPNAGRAEARPMMPDPM